MSSKVSKPKKKSSSHGFQTMGFSYPVYKAIIRKGYQVPTPIQRKTIPMIMEGRDVVGMARTGAGKTAAYVLPLLEKLKSHSPKIGARALILSPTRELAVQIWKNIKEFGKYTDLRTCVLVGGDSMDDQFATMANNPDVIVATPGRLLHLIVEMNHDMKTIEYVVFDEADRLFEMGLASQLHDIVKLLPESRQTLLFSATLPKLLVDFAQLGLKEPTLVRLDTDTKISEDLEMAFISVKLEDKLASLLFLLENVINSSTELTIVFVSTHYLVEFLQEFLQKELKAPCSYIYGKQDPLARKLQMTQFQKGESRILFVTDVAARGLDIPLLDNVILYDFPDQPKLFLHRVGRAARAGRRGTAYSFISSDDLPYLLDLQLFLGRKFVPFTKKTEKSSIERSDLVLGDLPVNYLNNFTERIQQALRVHCELSSLSRTVKNAYQKYFQQRQAASSESYKRSKEISLLHLQLHPKLSEYVEKEGEDRLNMLSQLRSYKPQETIFEMGNHTQKIKFLTVSNSIQQKRKAQNNLNMDLSEQDNSDHQVSLEACDEEDVAKVFAQHSSQRSQKIPVTKRSFKDEDYYIDYRPKDVYADEGYSLQKKRNLTSFTREANDVAFELTADDSDGIQKKKGTMTWDRKKKKFVKNSGESQRLRNEAGQLIKERYKTNIFEEWQKKTKIRMPRAGEMETDRKLDVDEGRLLRRWKSNKLVNGSKPGETPRDELKKPEQIHKERRLKEMRNERQKGRGFKSDSGGRGEETRSQMSAKGGIKKRRPQTPKKGKFKPMPKNSKKKAFKKR